ncbi:MAG: endonuclease/exonuclease/phosphatase family protein [Planctomycetes bacterium]|nr:endonuclease/exonuclease/phosphatase family protein [Planctomycetota bacterium]
MILDAGSRSRRLLRTAQLAAVLLCGSMSFDPDGRPALAAVQVVPAATAAAMDAPAPLMLQSLNVFGLPWPLGDDVERRCDAIAERIARERPAVVALQEVWTDAARTPFALDGYHRAFGDGPLGFFTEHGLLTLSRFPIVRAAALRFSCAADADRCVHKGLLHTRLDLGEGRQLDVFNVHLQSGADNGAVRVAQVRELARFVAGNSSGPFVLLGDFNCEAGDPEFELMRRLLDRPTIRCSAGLPTYDCRHNPLAAPEPPTEIDHILIAGGLTLRGAHRFGADLLNPLSDHFGISAEVCVPNRVQTTHYLPLRGR